VSGNAVAAVAGSRAEAYLIAGLLEANGIAAIVSTDDAGGQEPQWQLTEGVRVLVATDDLARAQALISKTPGGQTRASDRHHGHDQEQPLQDLDGPRTHPSAQGRGLDIQGGGWAAGAPEYDDTSSARFWRTITLGGTLTPGPVPGASSPDPTPEHFLAKGSR
jgi:hypothetical protein